jgi:hypothetical protein
MRKMYFSGKNEAKVCAALSITFKGTKVAIVLSPPKHSAPSAPMEIKHLYVIQGLCAKNSPSMTGIFNYIQPEPIDFYREWFDRYAILKRACVTFTTHCEAHFLTLSLEVSNYSYTNALIYSYLQFGMVFQKRISKPPFENFF